MNHLSEGYNLGSYGKNLIFGPKTEISGTKKCPLHYSNHVLSFSENEGGVEGPITCAKKTSLYPLITFVL